MMVAVLMQYDDDKGSRQEVPGASTPSTAR